MEHNFFSLDGQPRPVGSGCFFPVHWCLTKRRWVAFFMYRGDNPAVKYSREILPAGQWEPAPCWQGGESQLWDGVPASPTRAWLRLV